MAEDSPLVMLSAGEASGDQHAAALFRELRKLILGVRGIGMGGPAMRAAGIELCFDSSGIGVIGLAEIARHYGEIRGALTLMQKTAGERHPDLLICVDYKEFNVRLAKAAKARGIKVLFYVSPQVWAWRPGRVKSYGRIIDHMAVIFPFELPYYDAYQVPATYVGHPLAGKVRPSLSKLEALEKFGLSGAGHHDGNAALSGPIIGLLPGSRANEIRRLMPVILQSARQLSREFESSRFLLFQAASVPDTAITGAFDDPDLDLRVIKGQDYDALQCCDAVITVSGTATLEVTLLGIPMVIVYRLAPLSYWLGRMLVKLPFIGLPNILAGKSVVREYIQHEATPANIAGEIGRILRDAPYAEAMRKALLAVRDSLGDRDGSAELARLAARMLAPAEA
ncbi:MAG: lipid-A-disaccharide synthase [Methylococcaceae bacterium]|nr:lipid-A-disaccharide synthase [Methylococcaceae bacterium]